MMNYLKLLQCQLNSQKVRLICQQSFQNYNYQQKLLSKNSRPHFNNLVIRRLKSSESSGKKSVEVSKSKNQPVKLSKSDLKRLFSLAKKEKWKISGNFCLFWRFFFA